MRVAVRKSETEGKVFIPSSKSVAHRAMICAFLAKKQCELSGNLFVGDIMTTADCLKNMGAVVEPINNFRGGAIINTDSFNDCSLNVKDSGSTFRFLLPVVTALGLKAEFCGTQRLANRPISELSDLLAERGARFSANKLPFWVEGQIEAGSFEITGEVSSQYITGLLLALPVLGGDSFLKVKGKSVSTGYVDVTLKVLNDFGALVEKTSEGFWIKGGQSYNAPEKYYVEGDWSSASFFMALGALTGKVALCGLDKNSLQADVVQLKAFEKAGVKMEWQGETLVVYKSEIRPIEFDATNSPDLVPCLSVLLATANGVSKIKGASRLKAKESDRLEETIKLLSAFKIKAFEKDDCLIINGGKLKPINYTSPDDHRMAMSAVVGALFAGGESVIDNVECVKKSYPEFFNDVVKVKGDIDVLSV